MATVMDAAKYILECHGSMTAMKLQKLIYYSQAWSLVWDEKPMFPEPIQAWANGPVAPALYQAHKGMFELEARQIGGDINHLDDKRKATLDAVLKFYGDKSSQWLSDLTHSEPPWKDARIGLAASERGDRDISHAAMFEYYGSL